MSGSYIKGFVMGWLCGVVGLAIGLLAAHH